MPPSNTPFNLAEYFVGDDRLRQIGDRVALESEGDQVTYAELRKDVDRWQAVLLERGVSAGDRVAMLLYDSPDFIACFLAGASIGALSVPMNTFLPAEQIGSILVDCGARLLVTERDLIAKAAILDGSAAFETLVVDAERPPTRDAQNALRHGGAAADTAPDAPAFLLYTSGSTGEPKGVLHLHGSIPFTVGTYGANILNLAPEDRVYSASRMFFAYGLGNSLSFPLAAGAVVLLDRERPTPEKVARLFAVQRPTVFFGVPALYRALLDFNGAVQRVDVSSLRLCVSAGEALPSTIFEEWRETFGLTITDGIGSTEMLHIFISNRESRARGGSSGEVVDGYHVRLLDDANAELAGAQVGNLWVRGASATVGYWKRPDLTERTILDGWVRTGDLYRRDDDEFFYHLGRSDDCFKVHGLWVSPVEVESALLSHESVAEAAVVSSVDYDGLATVRACVVIRRGDANDALKEEIRSHVAAGLAHYKVPSQIEFISEMPRTSTGKIQRFKLRTERRAEDTNGRLSQA